MHVYLVDDERVPLRVLKMAVERAGYVCECFHNGRDALERIRESQPAALVTDIEMPVMTGEELCGALEAELPEREFPIFVVTGVTDLNHRGWSRAIKDLHFIEKPISAKALIAALDDRLREGDAA
ncbi:MAG: response regulator [Pseudomonadota bacterium]